MHTCFASPYRLYPLLSISNPPLGVNQVKDQQRYLMLTHVLNSSFLYSLLVGSKDNLFSFLAVRFKLIDLVLAAILEMSQILDQQILIRTTMTLKILSKMVEQRGFMFMSKVFGILFCFVVVIASMFSVFVLSRSIL